MVRVYANSIERGARTIGSVPAKLRDEVEALVISEGYEFDKKGYAHKKAAEPKEINEEE